MIRFIKDWYADTISAGENGDVQTVFTNIMIILVIMLFIYNTLSVLLGQ